MTDGTEADRYLPLRPVELQIMACLSRGPRHGYAILQETDQRGEGVAVPGLTTLYRTLKRLEEDRLIEEAPEPELETERDDRRRVFVLTPLGTRVVDAELRRLRSLTHGLAEWTLGEEG